VGVFVRLESLCGGAGRAVAPGAFCPFPLPVSSVVRDRLVIDVAIN